MVSLSHALRVFSFGQITWNIKTMSVFVFLIALPEMLGMANIATPWGFRIHFFQIAVIFAGILYGPLGGLISGSVGSIYSAILMHNPYIIVGNALFGFFVGIFTQKKISPIFAVILAYCVQLPWLIVSDIYFAGLPTPFVKGLVIALAISNFLWAIGAQIFAEPLKKILK